MTETYPAAVVTPPEATGESTSAARTPDVHELRNRIDHVRSWLGTNHGLTYAQEEYISGIHMLLVHGVAVDATGRPLEWDCKYEDDRVGAVGGPDSADALELLDRIAKVETWLKTPCACDYVPTEYLIGVHAFLIHGAIPNALSAQPGPVECTCA